MILDTLSPVQRDAHEAVVAAVEAQIERYRENEQRAKQEAFDERCKWIEQKTTCIAIAQGCIEVLLAAAIITAVKNRRCPAASWAAGVLAGGAIGYRICNYTGLRWSLKEVRRQRKYRKEREQEKKEEFIDSIKNDQEAATS